MKEEERAGKGKEEEVGPLPQKLRTPS